MQFFRYHIPRSFLNVDGEPNTLTLFEEAGGDPGQINFQTVTVGSVCAHVPEGKTMNLACQGGRTISKIDFASFGDPQGTCGSFQVGACHAHEAHSTISMVNIFKFNTLSCISLA